MPLTADEIDEMERYAMKEESLMALYVGKLCLEVRHLKHELADPNYLYGGRICRQAVLCRNATIDALRAELADLKKEGGSPCP